jgi:hypothetical protein
MAATGQRHRDSNDTAVEGGNTQPKANAVTLNNPLQTPEKTRGKPKDEEAVVQVNEKASLSDSSIKVKQLTWIHAGMLCLKLSSCTSD